MSDTSDIPAINITTEPDDDDDEDLDDNDEERYLNIAEALTDIEDLNDSAPPSPIRKKNKLIIKLPDYNCTDLEDFEADDDDCDEADNFPAVQQHRKPLDLDDLDIEAPLIEESYKKQDVIDGKGKKQRSKTEFASRQKSFFQSQEEDHDDEEIEGYATDMELFDSDNEIREDYIPDTVFNLDLYKSQNLVSDNANSRTPSPVSSDFSDDSVENIPKYSLSAPQIKVAELTDVELLGSDSDSEAVERIKVKNRRRRRRNVIKNNYLTDLEDINLSDNTDAKKKLSRKSKSMPKIKHLLVKSNTIPSESENEDDERPFPFPICKKIATKNKVSSMRVPDFDTNFHTDIEDLEADDDDVDLVSATPQIDEKALEENLKELATGYGHVNEEASKIINSDINSDNTDEEKFQSDEAFVNNNDGRFSRDNSLYNIKFSPSVPNLKVKNECNNKNILSLPINPEDPVTDCENLDSSPDIEDKKIPLAVVLNDLTENEEFSDDEPSQVDHEEIEIPPPIRNLILIKENDTMMVPTIEILPLDNFEVGDDVASNIILTDEELISEAEDALELFNIPDNPIINLANMDDDGGSIYVQDNAKKSNTNRRSGINESATDTEDLAMMSKNNKPRRKRAPKFKAMFAFSKNTLSPAVNQNAALTDTEDINLSDEEITQNKIKKVTNNTSSLSSSSEEDMASAEENLNNSGSDLIMYLKGGGYNNPYIDCEYYQEEKILFDFNKNYYALQDWNTSRKPADFSDHQPTQLKLAAKQELTSCELTNVVVEPSLTITDHQPQPKPRSLPLDFSSKLPPNKSDKILSPVRDDLLDKDEEDLVSYSVRKQFWENVSKDSAEKRMSLHEISTTEKNKSVEMIAKKRTSIHEIGRPPIPKPRTLQTAQSLSEVEQIEDEIATSLPQIIEHTKEVVKSEEEEAVEQIIQTKESSQEKDDSPNSDRAQKGSISSQLIEPSGYISDSEDVENVISDSEIEDRVPQIRERQMSVFSPPVTQRKTIYERSTSLPTEDFYVVSQNLNILKEKYEQKIKEDLIEEQFGTDDNEEESSPERKTLAALQEERLSAVKSMVDDAMAKIDEVNDSDEESSKSCRKQISFQSFKIEDSKSDAPESETFTISSSEVHVDKSEIEQSEKFDQKETSTTAKVSAYSDKVQVLESPLKQPEQHIQDTLWETTIETQSSIDEKVDLLFGVKQQMKITEDFISTEKVHEQTENYNNMLVQKEISIEEDETSQLEHVIKRQSITEDNEKLDIQKPEEELSNIKENISEILTKEIQEKLNESLKAQDITIEKAVSEEVDDKNLDELKKIMLEEALEELQQGNNDKLPTDDGKVKIDQEIKDEDLTISSGLKDESDLLSDTHGDYSDSAVSERGKSEGHNSEIEKIILDTFQHMKMDPIEAQAIATQLIEEIENELQNRGELTRSEASEQSKVFNPEMINYIKQLAETNGLDEREVELVESVLARRQRELSKLARADTQASSMEITDEELRYSGGELADYMNTLEQQMGQLEAEKVSEGPDFDLKSDEENFQDSSESFEKIDEKHVTEKHFSQDFDGSRKDTSYTISDSIKGDKSHMEHKNVIFEEDEAISESSIEDHAKIQTHIESTLSDLELTKKNDVETVKCSEAVVTASTAIQSDKEVETKRHSSDKLDEEIKKELAGDKEETDISAKYISDSKSTEKTKDIVKEVESTVDKSYKEHSKKDEQSEKEEIQKQEILDDGTLVSTNISTEKQQFSLKTEVFNKDQSTEKIITIQEFKPLSITDRTSSSDSKSSIESSKSPEKRRDHVILRRAKTEVDTSSSSSNLKSNRRSAIEFETYSSSGESHYHSFDLDSAKSRPCSSDVEGIMAAASSEYDTAFTSTQEFSAKSHVTTSTDYHTAISSLSSKESMKSLDSESSGHLGSIEVSEHSETLVPTTSDLDGDMLDSIDQQILDDTDHSSEWVRQNRNNIRQGTELTSDSDNGNESIDISEDGQFIDLDRNNQSPDGVSKMKRSAEMTFQPELKILSSDLMQQEKLGQSLDDGSVLSMSVSSTTSSTGAQRTVIEMFEKQERSMSVSGVSLEHFSMDETMQGSQESLPLTPTLQKTYDISTSTPHIHPDLPVENVTITTSSVNEDGIFNASTQITSEIGESLSKTASIEEPQKKRHRRTESTMMGISLPYRQVDANKSQDDEDEEIEEIKTGEQEKELIGYKAKDLVLDIQKKSYQEGFISDKRESHGKSSSTSSEKSSFEEGEAEAVFSMVAHISPAHKVKQIIPILEDEDAEKHELELKEKQQKDLELKRTIRDISSSSIPNITVTDMTPDSENPSDDEDIFEKKTEEIKDEIEYGTEIKKCEDTTEDEASNNQFDILTSSMMQSALIESTITGDEVPLTAIDKNAEKDADSQSTDSFEMLEKPDIIDDFVVIEEVGREAQEFDTEGKSVKIDKPTKPIKKHDEDVEKYLAHSAPTPLTGNVALDEFGFEFEDSPPRAGGTNGVVASTREYGYEYDKELEANKNWIEQQLQADKKAADYGYEMEFERAPLEDIKEEDINDFAASSYGSHKELGGSLGSNKDSYSSTPDYDVLAGRKYFTRSGDQDDISMNSLQEFEKLEQAMSLEMRKFHQGSDSSSSGSSKTRFNNNSKNNTGDDISASSLKEFERLEFACIQAHKIEIKANEEEALLTQIDEGQESIASESESCETVGTEKKIADTDDEEDYEKRMFEIDAIIKQAQTNVERFVDLKEIEKTESLGRGDSIEEVSRVPELELDTPLVKSTIKVQWKENENVMITSSDSLEFKKEETVDRRDSADSLDAEPIRDVMTASTDSIEFHQAQKAKDIMTDSIEIREEKRDNMVSSDSLELGQATSSGLMLIQTDSIDEDGSRIGGHDHSSASTGKDFSSSAKEEILHEPLLLDIMQHSIDESIIDPTSSSAATHATMHQFETDSIISGSMTSGGSNTMVSSTDTIDHHTREMVDVGVAAKKVWFDDNYTGRRVSEYTEEFSKPFIKETVEHLDDDDQYSHIVHRKVELPTQVTRVTFIGPDADEQIAKFMQDFDDGEEVQETEEIDEYGNVHTKRVVQKRVVIQGAEGGEMSTQEIQDYFRKFNEPNIIQEPDEVSISSTSRSAPSGDQQDLGDRPSGSASSVKAETEEARQEKEKKIADQHRLSDEMKELLKEMEKQSKN